ncbi:hypothetical protein DL93DRAFT_488643 [Clavulina sp. PMI_390]|nr:hypothetical protein DL93DRAFT_488643 [Clavulina sp. PMI_390]
MLISEQPAGQWLHRSTNPDRPSFSYCATSLSSIVRVVFPPRPLYLQDGRMTVYGRCNARAVLRITLFCGVPLVCPSIHTNGMIAPPSIPSAFVEEGKKRYRASSLSMGVSTRTVMIIMIIPIDDVHALRLPKMGLAPTRFPAADALRLFFVIPCASLITAFDEMQGEEEFAVLVCQCQISQLHIHILTPCCSKGRASR